MIRYSLSCDAGHAFETWFRNSDECDSQCAQGLVACPICGSAAVGKSLMAPAVSTSRKKAEIQSLPVPQLSEVPAAGVPAGPGAGSTVSVPAASSGAGNGAGMMVSEAERAEVLGKLRELKAEIVKNSDYVGDSFAEEARKIHYGEAESRNIYGETKLDEAKELLDEGISILPLPVLPEDRN